MEENISVMHIGFILEIVKYFVFKKLELSAGLSVLMNQAILYIDACEKGMLIQQK